ncbi:hypothetical protein [Patulibacter defluvii]|uniref:hypothetical protein n=1 Tax=Patulibacter defluvii TaxID=3095358 RepID=UPI002A74A140|nr:hypothetical protein [Patulibacter sp. DM4]
MRPSSALADAHAAPAPARRRANGRSGAWRVVDVVPSVAVDVALADLDRPGRPRLVDVRDRAMMTALDDPLRAAIDAHDQAAESCWEAETAVRRFACGVGQWPEGIGVVGEGRGDRWPPVLVLGPYLRLVEERLLDALDASGLRTGWSATTVPLWDATGRVIARFQALSVTGRVAGGAAAASHDPHGSHRPDPADVWVDPNVGRRGPPPVLALVVDPRWPELVPALVASPSSAAVLRATGVLGLDLPAVREADVSVPAPSPAPAAARARRRR